MQFLDDPCHLSPLHAEAEKPELPWDRPKISKELWKNTKFYGQVRPTILGAPTITGVRS